MKHLRVWQKLAVLGILFLVPFAVVTFKLVSSVNTLSIEFNKQEGRGVEYIDRLLALLHNVQDHRDLAALSSIDPSKDELQAKASAIEKDIQGVDDVERNYGSILRTGDRWPNLKKNIDELLKTSGASASES